MGDTGFSPASVRERKRFAETLPNIPRPASFRVDPDQYLERLSRAKASVQVPIIASLNGYTEGGWIEFAKQIRQTGVDGLELNIYSVPADPNESSIEIETRYLRIVSAVKATLQIPVAVKLSPYFTSFANVARKFVQQGGADALILFNRFYQPDVDPERLEVVPDVVLSTQAAHLLPLRWIAILRGKVQADLAATGGIHSATDIVKLLMAGANAPDRVEQFQVRHSLNQVGLRSGGDRFANVLVALIGSEHDHGAFGPFRLDRANCLYTAHLGHSQIHQDHVRPVHTKLLDRLPAVRCLCDELHVRLSGEQLGNPVAEERMVIDGENADRTLARAHGFIQLLLLKTSTVVPEAI